MYLENLLRIDNLRSQIHSLIISRENELRLRWETKVERIYFDLSLYDLSFSKKNISKVLHMLTPPKAEKEVLIYRWNDALSFIYYNCFFPQKAFTDDALYDVMKLIEPDLQYKPFQDLPEYVRYVMAEDHPLTKAALLQLIIYNLKPFPSLNEPFSHLAFDLALFWHGWDLRGLVCIEEQYFHDRSYFKELIRNTYISGNVTQWLEYVAEVYIRQLDKIVYTFSMKQLNSAAKKELFILTERQKKILAYLDEPGTAITNRKIQNMLRVSQMTSARDLTSLVNHGLIVSHGKGRGTHYTRV